VSLRDTRAAAPGVATLDPTMRRMERRRRVGVVNRRLGWVVLPIVVLASGLHFGADFTSGLGNEIVLALQWVFVPLVLVHAALSFYVFGWVRPSRSLRVFHVWFGYAYLLLIVGSNATWSYPTLHGVLTAGMFLALAAHVAIGVHYARRRRSGLRLT
jgi:hypothetical protein